MIRDSTVVLRWGRRLGRGRRSHSSGGAVATDTRRWRAIGHVGILGILMLYGVPVLWMLTTSFKSEAQVVTFHWLPTDWQFTAYGHFVANQFGPALLSSAEICGMTTIFSMLLAVPAAYGLAAVKSRLVGPALLFILLVQMVPTSATFIPLFLILAKLGLLNTTLGVALADTSLMTPFAILILRPAFMALPVELADAAAVDGAGSLRYLLTIAIPLLRNSLLVVAAIVFVSAWAELIYALTFILDDSKYPVSAYIAEAVGRYGNQYPNVMAIAVVASLPVLGVVLMSQKQLRRGLTLGAIR